MYVQLLITHEQANLNISHVLVSHIVWLKIFKGVSHDSLCLVVVLCDWKQSGGRRVVRCVLTRLYMPVAKPRNHGTNEHKCIAITMQTCKARNIYSSIEYWGQRWIYKVGWNYVFLVYLEKTQQVWVVFLICVSIKDSCLPVCKILCASKLHLYVTYTIMHKNTPVCIIH